MDQEQKEKIYREYSANNMKKLRKLIGYQTTRFGKGCGYKWVDKDYDEFLSMANMQLWKILESFNEEENDSFDDYLKTMMVRKMKQTCTWCNRDKRQQYARDKDGNKITEEVNGKKRYILIEDVSIYSEIEEGITIEDGLKSSFDVFEEVTSEKYVDEKIKKYLNQLSILQKKIVNLLSAGYKKREIIIELHITEKEYVNNLDIIQDYRNTKFLI